MNRNDAFLTLAGAMAMLLFSACLRRRRSCVDAAAPQQKRRSAFTVKDAEAVITDTLVKAGAGEDIKVSIGAAREDDVIVSDSGLVSAEADNLEIDKAHNHWQAILLLKSNGRNLAPMKLSGRYDEMMSVPILKRRIQSSEVIGEEDIDWDKQPVSRLRKNVITNAHELIGKSPKHVISQGRPIRTDEIARPVCHQQRRTGDAVLPVAQP